MTGNVPRLWPGSTIVCLASGPSLTAEDVESCRGKARVIAVKDAIRLAPWADVLYGAGADVGRWWQHNGPRLTEYPGLRFTLDPAAATWATVLRDTGYTGLESDPSGLRTGKNSGYQSINLAVHLGASRIILLGFDLQEGANGQQRWFGQHPWQTRPWAELGKMCAPIFDTLVQPLAERGISINNASRETALTCFPRLPITEALALRSEVAA
jgi:hypothetical protein